MIAPLDTSAKRCGDLHDEGYALWIFNFCAARKIPWNPDFAHPNMGAYPDGPAFGPIAAARQERALAAVARKGEA